MHQTYHAVLTRRSQELRTACSRGQLAAQRAEGGAASAQERAQLFEVERQLPTNLDRQVQHVNEVKCALGSVSSDDLHYIDIATTADCKDLVRYLLSSYTSGDSARVRQ